MPDEAADLNAERPERNQINDPEESQKEPCGARVGGWRRHAPPQARRHGRPETPMAGDGSIDTFADERDTRNMFVRPQRRTMAAKRQRSKDRFGAFGHAPVNLDQLNGVRKPVARNVGKSLGDIRALERLVIDDPARVMSPPRDPEPAKAAVA